MNRNVIIDSIGELKGEIEKELIASQSGKLVKNYERGIQLCNEMIARVNDEALATTSESLQIDKDTHFQRFIQRFVRAHGNFRNEP